MSDARRSTACHEAGHAVAHVRCGSVLSYATIVKKETTLGCVDGSGDEDLICYYAGYAADLECGRDPAEAREGARFDFDNARDFDSQHDEAEWIEKSRAFVRANWPAIELIAAQLLEHNVLFCDELYVLVEVADGESTMEDLERLRARLSLVGDDLTRRREQHRLMRSTRG
jgi:hypothetical protein